MGKSEKKGGDYEISLVSVRFGRHKAGHEPAGRRFVLLIAIIVSLFLVVYGVINDNIIGLLVGISLTSLVILNAQKPVVAMKSGAPNKFVIGNRDKNGILASLFIFGIVVFAIGALFKETFTFISGLMIAIISVFYLENKKKHGKGKGEIRITKKVLMAYFFSFTGLIMSYYGLVKISNQLLFIGLVLAVASTSYLLNSHFRGKR